MMEGDIVRQFECDALIIISLQKNNKCLKSLEGVPEGAVDSTVISWHSEQPNKTFTNRVGKSGLYQK